MANSRIRLESPDEVKTMLMHEDSLEIFASAEVISLHFWPWNDEIQQRVGELCRKCSPLLTAFEVHGDQPEHDSYSIIESILACKSLAKCLLSFPSRQLRAVRVTAIGLSTQGLKTILPAIGRMESVEVIDFSGNAIDAEGMLALQECLHMLPAVRHVDMSCQLVTGTTTLLTYELCQNSTAWQSLDAFRKKEDHVLLVDDSIKTILDQASSIAMHHVEGTASFERMVSDPESAETVARMVYLTLTGVDWSEHLLQELGRLLSAMPELLVLHIDGSEHPMPPSGIALLSNALGECSHLQALQMSNLELTDDAVCMLAPFFHTQLQLYYLDLSENKISAKGLESLSLELFERLRVLHLHCNQLGGAGARNLSNCLPKMKDIEELFLGTNELGKDGTIILAPVLQELKELRRLDYEGNDIGNEGIAALAACLPTLPCLKTLDIRNAVIRGV